MSRSAENACQDQLFVVEKHCPDCNQTLPADAFRRNASVAGGLSHYCKKCYRLRDAVGYQRKRERLGKVVRARPVLDADEKRCSRCGVVKPLSDFHRAASQAKGRSCYCKECRRTSESDARILRLYGITREQLDALIAEQGGLCAVCRERPAEHVDHDHVSGEVRGVLCFPCNAALGQLMDRSDLLLAAADYLERITWQKRQVCTGVFRLTSPRPAPAPSRTSSELRHLICSRRG